MIRRRWYWRGFRCRYLPLVALGHGLGDQRAGDGERASHGDVAGLEES